MVKSTRHNASLDGLRGIASLLVVFSHMEAFVGLAASPSGLYTQQTLTWRIFRRLIDGEYYVSLFFVLSGYVLAQSFLRGGKTTHLFSVILKRYFRLTPMVLGSTLFAYIISITVGFHTIECAKNMGGHAWLVTHYSTALNFAQAIKNGLWGTYLGDATYNGSLWTIRIEYIGSIVLFVYCALLYRSIYFFQIALLSAFLLCYFFGNDGLYCSLFLAGAVLVKNHLLLSSFWLLPTLLLATQNPWSPEVMYVKTILPDGFGVHLSEICHAFASILTMILVLTPGCLHKALSCSFFAFLGRMSFSMYAFHFPIVAGLGTEIIDYGYSVDAPRLFAVLAIGACLLTTVFVSILVYPYLDLQPQKFSGLIVKRLEHYSGYMLSRWRASCVKL